MDEIHADLIFPEHKHIPLAKLAGEDAEPLSGVAPTKTFNLAGVQVAIMIATNEEVREKISMNAMLHGQMDLSAFAATALKAAYEEGGPWLEELLTTLSGNMDYVIRELTVNSPV